MGTRALLNPTAQALGITPHRLRIMAKNGEIPVLKCGTKYVFDVEQCETFLKNKAMENVKSEDKNCGYGVLRKIGGN
ncbi:MAG: hypothetical protein H7Y18_16800 [Clostridiaceae bacterium]|nr:hypothetical protein [Clostridiaceae bacterium]